jgi:acyl-CoA thioesterase
MSSAVQDLLNILDLEPLEVNLFRGRSPQVGWQRVFGGQVIGQALVAAVRTVEGRPPHSLHAYFLLPGDPKVPIIYDVDRIRDGKSFTTRRVTARQHGHPIFSMAVSFHTDEPGLEHQAQIPNVLHRPFRADEWLLYAQDSPNLHGSRGFARGLIFTRDGTLVASVAQEGLVRQRRQT